MANFFILRGSKFGPFCFIVGLVMALSASLSQLQANQVVDLELVLLADASGSIDNGEIKFQREGYAQALQHPEVLAAITGGMHQRIALTYVEWGQANSQEVVVPWTIIAGKKDAIEFGKKLLAAPRIAFGRNAIGSALAKGEELLETNVIRGLRRVIDFSADSAYSFGGPDIASVRQRIINKGITINGLAILCREKECGGRPVYSNLEDDFKEQIIGGPGSFVVTADSRKTFAAAVRRKMILEIAALK